MRNFLDADVVGIALKRFFNGLEVRAVGMHPKKADAAVLEESFTRGVVNGRVLEK